MSGAAGKGTTALVLAGGGTKGSFEAGALRYLIGIERIVPDIITATSAGAIAGSVLAQARTYPEFAQRVEEVDDDVLAMTRGDQVFGQQAWLRALEGTTLGGAIRLGLTRGTRPVVPPLQMDGLDGVAAAIAPDPPAPRSPRRAARRDRRRRRRQVQRLVAGAAVRLPRARRKLRTSGSAVLNLTPLANALRQGGPSGIHRVEPGLIARPGLQLRLAVTALRAGALRYVTQDGTIVEDDAVTPAPGASAGPVDVLDGVIASASVPLVFPPRRLADDDYVDGGVLQVVPVRAAAQLGASRIIAVLAVPLRIEREERNYAEDNAANIGLRALGAIALTERQRENLDVALPPGATLVTIDPVVDVVGYFEVEPGLLRINKDYGWLRAADVMAEGDATMLAGVAAGTHRLTEARLQAWHVEESVCVSGRIVDADAGTVALLRELKRQVREIVEQRKQLGFPVPDGAEAWWSGYEMHNH
jgi:predicted acylesterase/phospholipase RssA